MRVHHASKEPDPNLERERRARALMHRSRRARKTPTFPSIMQSVSQAVSRVIGLTGGNTDGSDDEEKMNDDNAAAEYAVQALQKRQILQPGVLELAITVGEQERVAMQL